MVKKWVVIYRCNYNTAQIVKSRLESEDIPVHLKYDAAGLVYAVTIDGLGEVEVEVPSRFAETAKDILKNKQNHDF